MTEKDVLKDFEARRVLITRFLEYTFCWIDIIIDKVIANILLEMNE